MKLQCDGEIKAILAKKKPNSSVLVEAPASREIWRIWGKDKEERLI